MLYFSPSENQAKKRRFVKYERKEAVKESKEKKREGNTKNLKVFVFPSSNIAEHESEVEERKEDERIINAYGVVHRCASKCPPKH